MVLFKGYHQDSRYERFRRLEVWSGNTAIVHIRGFNFSSGGVSRALGSSKYTLLIDGVARSTFDVSAGAIASEVTISTTDLAAGWHSLQLGSLGAGETCPTWWVYLLRGTSIELAAMPVVRGTYQFTQNPGMPAGYALAPGGYAPTPRPAVRRPFIPFDSPLVRADLHCQQLVPVRFGDVHRPNRNKEGIVSSFDTQPYFWYDLIAPQPKVPLLDGPRGVGTVCMVTHIELGTAAPDGLPRNNIYFCDPWRFGKVSEEGHITTLAGYRHRGILSHWEDAPDVELIGDWSAVPQERRGFRELWGMAWDTRTLPINEAAARIPSENNERPHLRGPVAFLADSQHNRICKVEFSATSHSAPAKVTEFITGLGDPWDIVYHEGLLYVSERTAHRISAFDASSGTLMRVLVQGRALAYTDPRHRETVQTATLAAIQAEPCVAPEGLFRMDTWLYFGSRAMECVKRVNVDTGAIERVCLVPASGNTKFMKLSISDGTFGPKGTVFTWSWSNLEFGQPRTVLPDGKRWEWDYPWTGTFGGAGQWANFVYATAGAVGNGRLVSGGANEGLLVITRKQASETVAPSAVVRGAKEYEERGLHLLHGAHGFGFYALRLPWGVSADIDAYLAWHGHPRT